MKKVLWVVPVVLIVLFQYSCKSEPNKTAAPATQEDSDKEAHGAEHTVVFTQDQIRSIGVETGKIEEKQLTASVRANGALRVPNQNKALINSLYSGVVKSLLIQPGNTVRKGQVIATIANPDFIRMQEEYLAIGPKLVLAEQEYKRQQELNEGNAGALKNLQSAESELRALNTRKASLEQQIALMGIRASSLSNGKLVSVISLRTPIAGIVSSVSVKMGTYVDVSTPVAEVVDNSQLHLDLFVYEKDLPKLKNNQHIHFTVTNNPGKEYDAQIYSLGSTFEDESKAVSVHAQVKGDKTGLIDGMSVTALISLDKVTTPAVPNDAIVTYQGQDYVFMVADGDLEKGIRFERIPVAKGSSEVGYTQVTLLKEIPADVRIVTKGAFFVLAKMTNTGEGEHE